MTTHDAHGNHHGDDGRFAAKPATESERSLHYEPNEAFDDLDPALLESVYRACSDGVGRYFGRGRADHDDRTHDVMAAFLATVAHKRREGKRISAPTKYAATIAKNQAAVHWAGTDRGPDQQAGAIFQERKLLIETGRGGRRLSEWEEKKLSDTIRQEIIDSGKQAPLVNFHRTHRNLAIPFSAMAGGQDQDGFDVADKLLSEQQMNAEQVTRRQGAEELELRRNRARVLKAGGVQAAAGKVLDGTAEPGVREALMAPWGESLDPATEQVVAEKLRGLDSGRRAREVWDQLAGDPQIADRFAAAARRTAADQHLIGEKVPPVTKRRMSAGMATRCREIIAEQGGSVAAARKLADGELDARATAALLAPWGGSDCRTSHSQAVAQWLSQQESDTCWSMHLSKISTDRDPASQAASRSA